MLSQTTRSISAADLPRQFVRPAPAHDQIQQHTERVHIGSDGDRAATNLLRRGEIWSERAPIPRQRPQQFLTVGCQQLRDPEVEKLHGAVGADEDVRWLEIAMDDQVGVGVTDCSEHVEDQPHRSATLRRRASAKASIGWPSMYSRIRYGWPLALTPASSSRAIFGCETRQDAALAPEALLTSRVEQGQIEQLDRHLAFETSVAATAQPHRAHPAGTERTIQRVGADRLTAARKRQLGHLGLRFRGSGSPTTWSSSASRS